MEKIDKISIISIQFYRKCNITENIGNHIKRSIIKIFYHIYHPFPNPSSTKHFANGDR